jgi:hypothetical protein
LRLAMNQALICRTRHIMGALSWLASNTTTSCNARQCKHTVVCKKAKAPWWCSVQQTVQAAGSAPHAFRSLCPVWPPACLPLLSPTP